MIITRTPYRVSFFGGGTDYPAHYNNYGGSVLSATIDKYCYISLRHLPSFFNNKHRIVWSQIEEITDIEEIKHPSVRECLRYMNIQEGLEIHHDGDLPARSGLGSSSSFTVGLLHALFAFQGKMISKNDLAEASIFVEQQMIKENVGSQDQTAVSFGGLNIINFNNSKEQHLHVMPLISSESRLNALQDHLMLFFTGIFRNSSEIAGEQLKVTPAKKKQLQDIEALVAESQKLLTSDNNICEFGRLLHESWKIKRSLTDRISTTVIDGLYKKARQHGALGGKLLGAGGGGFLLFFVKPEDQAKVREALGLLHVPFRFEYSGSQVIFYEKFSKKP